MMREKLLAERWFFYQDTAGQWKWARLDVLGTILDHSGRGFEMRDACVEHARTAGYHGGRRERGLAVPPHRPPPPALLNRDQSV